jgi:glyoxylase-like metal-dependent hydrolase (beta-lactamase superfamily II)
MIDPSSTKQESSTMRRNSPSFAVILAAVLMTDVAPGNAQVIRRWDAPSDRLVRTGDVAMRGLTAKDFPRLIRLGDNLYGYEELGNPIGSGAAFTTNSLIVVTRDGVAVVDAQANDAQTKTLVETIGRLTPQPIKYVIIGADHADHIGGNAAFPAGVTFVSSPVSKAAIERFNAAPGRSGTRRPLPVPQETVADERALMLGGEELHILNLGRAHTGGDLEVFLPRENILWMSEVFFNRIYPSVGGGFTAFPSEWIDTIKKAEAMKARVYVPNHGFLDPPRVLNEEMVNFRHALENVVSEAKRLHSAGASLEAAYRNINLGEFQYWYRAANNMPDCVRKVYAEEEGRER